MAVLDELGLEVTIEVAGEPAQEYPDPDHDIDDNESPTNTHGCYIESRAGAEYCIVGRLQPGKKQSPAAQWIVKDKKNGICFDVSFDGGGCAAGAIYDRNDSVVSVDGVVDYAEQKQQMFCFSAVSTGTYAAVPTNLLFIAKSF